MTNDAYIFDAIRTPRGRGKAVGSLHEVKPIRLLTGLMDALIARNPIPTEAIDDVILGCVTPVGEQGGNIAKTAASLAGWADDIAGVQINRYCASGADAVNTAAMKVRSGWESLIVAGGIESMSRVPMGSDGGPWALDPETNYCNRFVPQGIGADLIATIDEFDRTAVDAFAARSHQKAAEAESKGLFDRSRIPVKDQNGRIILARDECIRPDTSVASLSGLKPSFMQLGALGFDAVTREKYPEIEHIQHVHHAGNSSGIVDGAALVLIGNKTQGEALGLKPRARIVSAALVGTDPTIMLSGPAPAARKALKIAGLSADDIDLFEINEAFASVVMRFQKELNVPDDKVNIYGGAIAMGHPLGATGAMIIGTLLDALEDQQKRYGMIAMCVGGGMGIATIIERCEA